MISSIRSPLIQRVRKLSKRGLRNAAGEFLVEGVLSVGEALDAGAPLEAVLWRSDGLSQVQQLAARADKAGIDVEQVSEGVMKAISGTVSPPGLIAVCRFIDRPAADLLEGPITVAVVLSEVRDPGNAGTILRTCRAAGVEAVFVGEASVDIYNPKLVRASAGALFNLSIARDVELTWLLDELGQRNIRRIAADPRGDVSYDQIDLTRPIALLVGNEAGGLPDQARTRVDVLAQIPMHRQSESLNVGIACAVILFEASRQRRLA